MPHDSQQVTEAFAKMREALALLDHAGAGATNCAFHLSLAVAVADQIELTDGSDAHRPEPSMSLGPVAGR